MIVLLKLHSDSVEREEEEELVNWELGGLPGMEEKLNKVGDTDVGREMRDEAVDPDVGNGEAEYGDWGP